ncbi:MAG: hypothetical protein C0439_12790 [Pseudomonas sp.]|nr:hypothetical protein [Pseudomonas sp.]
MTVFQGVEQLLQLFNRLFGFKLRLGFTRYRSVLHLAARFVQFLLSLTALLFQLGEQLLGFDQSTRAGVLQVLKQAVGELLQQVQRGAHGFLLRILCCGHDAPPGG